MQEAQINKLEEIKENQQKDLVFIPINTNYEEIFTQTFADMGREKIKNLIKSSGVEEISDLDNMLSFNITFSKTLDNFKTFCQLKFKEGTKKIVEKIGENIDKTQINYNNTVSILDDTKKNYKLYQILQLMSLLVLCKNILMN